MAFPFPCQSKRDAEDDTWHDESRLIDLDILQLGCSYATAYTQRKPRIKSTFHLEDILLLNWWKSRAMAFWLEETHQKVLLHCYCPWQHGNYSVQLIDSGYCSLSICGWSFQKPNLWATKICKHPLRILSWRVHNHGRCLGCTFVSTRLSALPIFISFITSNEVCTWEVFAGGVTSALFWAPKFPCHLTPFHPKGIIHKFQLRRLF